MEFALTSIRPSQSYFRYGVNTCVHIWKRKLETALDRKQDAGSKILGCRVQGFGHNDTFPVTCTSKGKTTPFLLHVHLSCYMCRA